MTGRRSVYPNIWYDFHRKKYYVAFDYGKVKNSRKRSTKTYDTAKDAVMALADYNADKAKNTLIAPDTITVEAYCEYWLSVHCASRRESTKIFYENIVNNHLVPALGDKQLQSVTTMDINRFLASQQKSKINRGKLLSASSVKKHRDTLCTIFDAAVNEEILSKNPAKKSNIITVSKKPIDAYDIEEVRKIIDCAINNEKTPHSEAYRLAIYTGLRKGELLGLQWKYVHLDDTNDDSYIEVKRARTDITKGPDTDELKTDSSMRMLRLAPDATEIFASLKKRYDENRVLFGDGFHDNDFVICCDDGSLYASRSLNRAFEKFLKRNNIRILPFNALRHTFGTLQRMTGASAYDIKEAMGHSSVVTAEKNYIKPFATHDRQKKQMAKMQNILSLEDDEQES